MTGIMQLWMYLLGVVGTITLGMPMYVFLKARKKNVSFIPYTVVMGTAQIVIISHWLSNLCMPMKYILYVIILYGVLMWLLAYKIGKEELFIHVKSDEWIVAIICFSAGVLPLFPMMLFHGCFPYGDGYTYICIADYLKDAGVGRMVQADLYHPWLTQISLYQVHHFRMGAQYLLAFWSSLFNQDFSIFVYAPVSGLGVFLFGSAVWIYVGHWAKDNKKRIIYAVTLSVFNAPIILWSAIYGFLPQLFGLSFMIVALYEMQKLVDLNIAFSKSFLIEAVLILSSMALCYSEILPFFVLVSVVILGEKVLSEKVLWVYIKDCILLGVGCFVALQKYAIDMIFAVISQFGAVVGGEQHYNWFSYLGYILSSVEVGFSYTNIGFGGYKRIVFAILTIVMLGFLTLGLFYAKDNLKQLRTFFIMSIPYFFMLVYFSSVALNPFAEGIGNSWGIYKLVQYYFIIPAITIFPFYADCFTNKRRWINCCGVIFLFGFIGVSCFNIYSYSKYIVTPMYNFVGDRERPLDEYLKLSEKYEKEQRVINLLNLPLEERKLITYFLRDNKLSSDWSVDGYFSIYNGENPVYDEEGITLKYSPDNIDSIAGLLQIDACVIDVSGLNGVGVEEKEADTVWTWNDLESEYHIVNYSNQDEITLQCFLSSAIDEADVDIYVDDELLTNIIVNDRELTEMKYILDVHEKKEVDIKMVYNGNVIEPNENDARTLALKVTNFVVMP